MAWPASSASAAPQFPCSQSSISSDEDVGPVGEPEPGRRLETVRSEKGELELYQHSVNHEFY